MMKLFDLFGDILINDKASAELAKINSGAKSLASSFLDMSKGIGTWSTKTIAAAAAVATAISGIALNSAMKFEEELSYVSTLLEDDLPGTMERFSAGLKDMSSDFNISTSQLTRGLYETISALGDTSDNLGMLEEATKAAKAGKADLLDAVQLMSASLKGYGDISTEAARKTFDLSFETLRLGQTTFPELAKTMGKVIPLANTLTISQEELFGATATLTGVTGNTARVMTQLRSVISALMNPNKELLNVMKDLDYKNVQSMVTANGMVGTLNILKEAVKGDEVAFSQLFGRVEATTAALALTGAQSEDFTRKFAAMYDATGAADKAFEKVASSTKYTVKSIANELSLLLLSIGQELLPEFNKFVTNIKEKMPQVRENIVNAVRTILDAVSKVKAYLNENSATIQKYFKIVVNGVLDTGIFILETLKWVVDGLDEFINRNQKSFDRLSSGFTDIYSGILKLAGMFWDTFGEDITNLITSFKDMIIDDLDDLIEFTSRMVASVGKLLNGDFKGAWEEFAAGFEVIRSNLEKKFDVLFEWLFENVPKLSKKIEETTAKITQAIVDWGAEMHRKSAEQLNKLITVVTTPITEFKDMIVNKFKEIVTEAMAYLESLTEKATNWVKDLPRKMMESGRNIAKGVAEGITDTTDAVVLSVKDMGKAMHEGFNKFWGIHSPSEVAKKQAWYIGDGIALGITDKELKVLNAMSSVSKGAVESFKAPLKDTKTGILSTTSAILQQGIDYLKGLKSKFNSTGAELAEEIAKGYEEHLKTIGATSKEAYEAAYEEFYKNLYAKPKVDIEKLATRMEDKADKISDIFSSLSGTIGGKLGDMFGAASEGFSGISSISAGIAEGMAGDWLGAASSIITGVGQLANSLSDIFGGLFKKRKTDLQKMQEDWNNTLSMLEGSTKESAGAMASAFTTLFKSINRAFATIQFSGINTSGIGNMASDVSKATQEALQSLKEFVKDASENITSTLRAMANSELSDISKLYYTLTVIIGTISDVVEEAIGNSANLTSGAMAQITTFVEDSLEAIQPMLEEFNSLVVSELDKLGSATVQALKNKYEQELADKVEAINNQITLTEEQKEKEIRIITEKYEAEKDKRAAALAETIEAINQNFSEKKKIYDDELAYRLLQIKAETDEKSRALLEELNALTAQQEEAKKLREQEAKALEENNLRLALANATNAEETAKAQAALDEFLRKERIAILQEQINVILEQSEIEIAAAEAAAAEKLKIAQEEADAQLKSAEQLSAVQEAFAEKKENAELAAAEAKYNFTLEWMEKELDAVNSHYAALLEASNLEAEALKLATDANQSALIDLLEQFYPDWQNAGQTFGQKLLYGLNSEKINIEQAVSGMLGQLELAQTITDDLKDLQQQSLETQAEIRKQELAAAEAQAAQQNQYANAQGPVIGVDSSGRPIYLYPNGQSASTSSSKSIGKIEQNITLNSPEPLDPVETAKQMRIASEQLALLI